MIKRTIVCGVKDCSNTHEEAGFNIGFPDWGGLSGVKDLTTGEEGMHICPECLTKILMFINRSYEK